MHYIIFLGKAMHSSLAIVNNIYNLCCIYIIYIYDPLEFTIYASLAIGLITGLQSKIIYCFFNFFEDHSDQLLLFQHFENWMNILLKKLYTKMFA